MYLKCSFINQNEILAEQNAFRQKYGGRVYHSLEKYYGGLNAVNKDAETFITSNFAKINIYTETMTVQSITEGAKYDVSSTL